eukprot:210791-Prymnesium_polylepis.2
MYNADKILNVLQLETKEEMPQVVVCEQNGSSEEQSESTCRPAQEAVACSTRHDAEDAAFDAPAAAKFDKSVQTAGPQAQRTASLSLRCARRGSQQ